MDAELVELADEMSTECSASSSYFCLSDDSIGKLTKVGEVLAPIVRE
jgi:hypothetical protein